MTKKIYLPIIILLFLSSCKGNTEKLDKKIDKKEKQQNKIDTAKYNLEKIENLYKRKSLDHEIISSNKWLNEKETIFVFENEKLGKDYGSNVNGFVYVFDKLGSKKIVIDTYEPAGRKAHIESFFFYNVDKDIEKELIVLCSWEQRLKETAEGKLYQTFIYDDYKDGDKLIFLEEISSYFGIEFEGIQEGEDIKAEFKTPSEIKSELKRMGY
jgi:hypothetical protein